MNSLKLLTTAIKTIRETTKIAASRGINMKYYRNELWVYKLPAQLSAIFMKRMFATNNLTRRIMELHGNIDDLQYICNSVYNEGKTNNVPAPVFYQYLEDIRRKWSKAKRNIREERKQLFNLCLIPDGKAVFVPFISEKLSRTKLFSWKKMFFFTKRNIFLHEQKYFSSWTEIFSFMKIIPSRLIIGWKRMGDQGRNCLFSVFTVTVSVL